jgi:hypothetical protein
MSCISWCSRVRGYPASITVATDGWKWRISRRSQHGKIGYFNGANHGAADASITLIFLRHSCLSYFFIVALTVGLKIGIAHSKDIFSAVLEYFIRTDS